MSNDSFKYFLSLLFQNFISKSHCDGCVHFTLMFIFITFSYFYY